MQPAQTRAGVKTVMHCVCIFELQIHSNSNTYIIVPFGLTVSLTTEYMAERQKPPLQWIENDMIFLLSSGKWWSSELNCDFLLAGWQSRIEGATCLMQWLPGSTKSHWDSLLNANGPRQKWGMKGQHTLATATKSKTLFHSLAKLCNVDHIMWHPCLQAALHHSNDK